MTRFILALTVAVLSMMPVPLSAQELNQLSEAEKAAGFELLFDGQTLDGWQQKGNWKIQAGAIDRAEKGGDITYKTKVVPDDFELRFDWRVGKHSNSGVYYRPGQYEYQVLDNAHPKYGANPRTSAAALYFCMPPSKDVTRPVGEWNEGRIVCQGTVIQHWLNGVKVVDFDYTDPKWSGEVDLLKVRGANLAKRGAYLNLQDHGDPVAYRNLKLRVIPKDEKLDRTPITPAVISEAALQAEKEYVDKAKAKQK